MELFIKFVLVKEVMGEIIIFYGNNELFDKIVKIYIFKLLEIMGYFKLVMILVDLDG